MSAAAEGKVDMSAPDVYPVADRTQPAWHAELSYRDGWDFMQLASVNENSPFEFPPEPGERPEKFDGWRVTLDKDALAELIARAQDIHARMP